jgi:4-nitrophenyl phosphatase
VKPTIVGKPGAAMMDVAVAHLGLPRDVVAMIGDRLETDILGAQNAGLISILLHGGVASSADMAASPIRADHVFYDLGDLLEHYERER